MVSASTQSAHEPAKDPISFHTVQLKPIIKPNFSRRMICSGVSDLAIASVHSEKTCLKKLMNVYTSFFHLLVNGFYVTSCVILGGPSTFLILEGRQELKWHQLSHHQLIQSM